MSTKTNRFGLNCNGPREARKSERERLMILRNLPDTITATVGDARQRSCADTKRGFGRNITNTYGGEEKKIGD
jgi:hypothetical protein